MKHLHAIKAQQEKGFTLLEITIVLFIAGILAAISAPSLLGLYRRNQLDNAVNEVRGALQLAQREAIRESDTCPVTFNNTADTNTDPVEIDSCISTTKLPKPVDIDLSSGSTITFGFRGNTNNNNTISFSSEAVSQKKCLAISMPLGIIREGIYDSSASECQKP